MRRLTDLPMREGLWDNGTDGSPSRIRRPSSGPSQKRSCTSNIPDGSKSDGYFCLTRSEQDIPLKLCTGHNKRNAHLFNKLETGQSEMCSCDTTPVITERLLQHCPFHDGLRRAAWPENRPPEGEAVWRPCGAEEDSGIRDGQRSGRQGSDDRRRRGSR